MADVNGSDSPVTRLSSRKKRLDHVFLKDRLNGAEKYDRIAGYFRSSVFNLIHEEISTIGKVRIVCNADLDQRDLEAARAACEQVQVDKWHEQGDEVHEFVERSNWGILHKILTAGNVEIRVVSRKNAPFLHGKAGIITRRDGTTSSFIGSINETASGWRDSYEMIWEDPTQEAADWVQGEFDWLWSKGVPLAQAVIDEIGRVAEKTEAPVEDFEDDPVGLAKSVMVESPLARRGESLELWQKAFVSIFATHVKKYGAARLLLADEVGLGKTLSMAAAGTLTVLLEDKPFLILCPANLTLQWQTELWNNMGLPACVWGRSPRKGWIDHSGHSYQKTTHDDILRCPTRIGIVSTGILVHDGEEAEALKRGKYGMIALDEGHRARVKSDLTKDKGTRKPGKLYKAMEQLAERTTHLVIGTATPIQTDPEEIWDLMKLLARGNDHVLGHRDKSKWWDAGDALEVIKGNTILPDAEAAWPWLQTPLLYASDHEVFGMIRNDINVKDKTVFTNKGLHDLDQHTRGQLDEMIEIGDIGQSIEFMRYHNPLGRHVVLRRRKDLEDKNLMEKIAVNIHPRQDAARTVFINKSVKTPPFYDRAYEEVSAFTRALNERQKGTGFLGNLMMQRICSSVAAGKSTARTMLKSRRADIDKNMADDPELFERIENMGADRYADALDKEHHHLEQIIKTLDEAGDVDPKQKAVLHYLGQKEWLKRGCIVFSQYYATAHWVGKMISDTYTEEAVAVYAGMGKSGVFLNGEWRTMNREDIKTGVRDRKIRVVSATDAACEGLNLQVLGTLINVDLPWNPSRLEQRLGRIKRYGQLSKEVDMANLVYADTVDEKVYSRLSERLHDNYEILGSLPDTIEDDWIDDIGQLEEKMKTFTKPESPADLFSLRYGDMKGEAADLVGWEVWTKVVSRRDVNARLTVPWNESGRNLDDTGQSAGKE